VSLISAIEIWYCFINDEVETHDFSRGRKPRSFFVCFNSLLMLIYPI